MSNPIRVVGAVFHDGERFLACRKKQANHWKAIGNFRVERSNLAKLLSKL